MNRIETAAILSLVKTLYPTFGQAISADDILNAWTEFFAADPAALVNRAVRQHINTSRFPPTVADIRAIITDYQTSDWPTPAQLWDELDSLIRRSGLNVEQSREAYALMSPGCQYATKCAGGWYAIGMSSESDTHQQEMFLKAAAEYLTRERRALMLKALEPPVGAAALPGGTLQA